MSGLEQKYLNWYDKFDYMILNNKISLCGSEFLHKTVVTK